MSKNPYTRAKSVHDEDIRGVLMRVDAYAIEGSNSEYSVKLPPLRGAGPNDGIAKRTRKTRVGRKIDGARGISVEPN